MNESDYQQLLETSWRRPLTPVEEACLQAHLAEHPETQAAWESDAGLNQLLGALPDAPLSSNFTARVLRAAEREAVVPPRPWLDGFKQLGQRPAPKLAWAAVFVALATLALLQFESLRHARMADGLARLAHVTATTDPRTFEDFDAIRGLSQASAPSDDALFAVLNQNQ